MNDLSIILASLLLAAVTTYVLSPLFRPPQSLETGDAASMGRERELLRRKAQIYQSIRDAELDRQTGKLSDEDYEEMVRGLKAEAVKVLRDLDGVLLPQRSRESRSGRKARDARGASTAG